MLQEYRCLANGYKFKGSAALLPPAQLSIREQFEERGLIERRGTSDFFRTTEAGDKLALEVMRFFGGLIGNQG